MCLEVLECLTSYEPVYIFLGVVPVMQTHEPFQDSVEHRRNKFVVCLLRHVPFSSANRFLQKQGIHRL